MGLSTYRNMALAIAVVTLPTIASASTRFVQSTAGCATSLTFNELFLSTFTYSGVTLGSIKPAVLYSDLAGFPISTGVLDLNTAFADVSHAGGLSLTAGSTAVVLADLVLDTTGAAPVITGDVIVNGSFSGRVDLFNVALPPFTLPIVPVNNVRVIFGGEATLTADAAAALNTAFGVTAFSESMDVGNARTTLILATGKGQ